VVALVQTIQFDFADEVPLAQAWVYSLLGGVAGLLALVLVGKGPWSRWARLLVLVLIGVICIGVPARHEYLQTEHRESELRSVGVTMYLPDLGDRATPSYASAYSERVTISYEYDEPPGGPYDFPSVALVPGTSKDTCIDAEQAGYFSTIPGSSCRTTRDGFVADDGYQHYVGVARADTLLVATFRSSVFDDGATAEALRRAPVSSIEELVRL